MWRHRDFLNLWAAQTVSRLGDHITFIAFPLTAVTFFKATASQMGMLRALYSASAVLIGLFAGLWIDRLRRRSVLMWTDFAFTGLYFSIPVATVLGILHIEHLYVIQLLSGILWFFSDVALRSFVPSLAAREQLVEANSKLGLTHSVASLVGPAMAGALVQLVTAPIAMVFDGLSFLVSGIFIWRIKAAEAFHKSDAPRKSSLAEISEGLRAIFTNPILRPLTESMALQHFFTSFVSAIFVLYASAELKIEPFFLGLIFSSYGPGFLLGALLTSRLTRRYGVGSTVLAASLLNCLAVSIFPLAGGSQVAIVALLMTAYLLIGMSLQVSEITMLSLRQSLAPLGLQGRVNGSFRFIVLSADLIGALLLSALGDMVSLRTIIVLSGVGLCLPFLRLLFSPVRGLHKFPD